MKIAFIHTDKKLLTGAHFANDFMVERLRSEAVKVKNFYPKRPVFEAPVPLKGFRNILFFYSLLEQSRAILKYDLIQGTTYTPLAFLALSIPVVSHFGSTSWGFLKAVPLAKDLEPELRKIWSDLKNSGVISELNLKTRRPLRDIAEIEQLVALKADAVIATSQIVLDDLLSVGVKREKIHLIANAIEDFWFDRPPGQISGSSCLVFLGRLGVDSFTLKLKGLDRLIDYYRSFPKIPKHTIGAVSNGKLPGWLNNKIPNHQFYPRLSKKRLPDLLKGKAGGILLITSRYEGFSLSLVEGMSQGLIPVAYPVGIAPEIIKNGVNGFLIRSQEEGKKMIDRLLRLSASKRRSLALAAAAAAGLFCSKTVSRRLLEVYRKTVKR
ncbi:MAG: glycosyltransferase family 4 protein [Parachlamydiales bacterium]|jgi:glycosyltransferase involved in cell wall biosynthesis